MEKEGMDKQIVTWKGIYILNFTGTCVKDQLFPVITLTYRRGHNSN